MSGGLPASERWFRAPLHCYSPDFRDEMGDAVVEAYVDRARKAQRRGGALALAGVWSRALADAVRNGLAERIRPAAAWRRGGQWGRDVEIAMRRLTRAPAFALATAGTLALGLGLFGVVFAVVQRVLVDPLPYKDPGDLYYVWRDYGPIADVKRGALAGTDLVELQKPNLFIEDVVGLQPFLGGIFSLREGSQPMEIAVTVTSPRLFEVLGATPALGRGFAADEVGPSRPNLMVLSHGLWRRLGADPALVGQDVRLQGNRYRVIGVMGPDFEFVRNDAAGPPQRADAYTTFAEAPVAGFRQFSCSALVRARRGASPQQVAAAVDAVGRGVDEREFAGRGLRLYPVGVSADLVARIRPALLVLAAAAGLLAAMLAVNLSSVLLARAARREHEYAVSRALGANGTAVVRASLLEGGLLGLMGGVLGALLAGWGTRMLVALAPLDLPRRDAIGVDWRIALGVVALGTLLGLLAAAPPAVWAARSSLSTLLAAGAVRGGVTGGRMRRGLIVAQVAITLVLLTSGGLVVRSLERLLRADPGFRPEGLLSVRVRVPPEFFPRREDAASFQERLQATLAGLPGVTGAGAASALPLTAAAFQLELAIPGAPGNSGDAGRDVVAVDMVAARAGFFEVMGMRLVEGRTFEPARPGGTVREALVDSLLARRFFPGTSPIGAQIPFRDDRLTVVGVVEPARLYDVHQDGRPQLYIRPEDWGVRPLLYVVRTTRDPPALLPEIETAVRGLDPRVAVGEPRTLGEIVEGSLRPQRASAMLLSAFAVGALLLAGMGLFGVVAASVTRRRRELAVRLALGADHGDVLRLVLGEGALLVAVGALVGVPGVYAAGALVRGVLIGISPWDPATLAAVALGLASVALLACYVPARRVVEIHPAQLLRQE